MSEFGKKTAGAAAIVVCFLGAMSCARPLANENLAGLHVRSIEQVLHLDPDEIDIGTAALIVAEEWSDVLQGRRYLTELDQMANDIQDLIDEKDVGRSYKAAFVLNDYLRDKLGFEAVKEATDPNDLFLDSVMDNKRGYCLSLSILYLALGERLGLPLYGVVVPGHFFVRYDGRGARFNIETTNGGYPDDDYYKKEFKVPQGSGRGIYMENLNKRQTLGCLFNNFGNVYNDIGKIDQAERALALAVKINPELAESRVNLGNIYVKKGRYDEAIDEYRRAIEINPAGPKVYHNLGNAYYEKGWLNDAIEAYEQAISLDANNVDAYMNLASAYAKKKAFSKAQQMLREAVSVDPGRADVYVKRGDIYVMSEDYDRAMDEYETALRIDRNSAAAYFGTGVCYNKQGMVKNEIQSYLQALQCDAGLYAARGNLADAYFRLKQYDKAIEQYKICLESASQVASIRYNIGAAYSNLGKYAEAVPYYEKALELEPQMADAHYNLGIADYKLEHYEQAYTHLSTAERLGAKVDPKLLKAIERKMP
jgi:tetratricopeptide (TPR) repeat protein